MIHPDYLMDQLTARQYEGWRAWMRKFRVIGPHRADVQFGLLTAAVINQWSTKPVRPVDVMPYYDEFEEDISRDELAQRILSAIG